MAENTVIFITMPPLNSYSSIYTPVFFFIINKYPPRGGAIYTFNWVTFNNGNRKHKYTKFYGESKLSWTDEYDFSHMAVVILFFMHLNKRICSDFRRQPWSMLSKLKQKQVHTEVAHFTLKTRITWMKYLGCHSVPPPNIKTSKVVIMYLWCMTCIRLLL